MSVCMWRCALCDSQICVCVWGGGLAADYPDGMIIIGVYK